MRIGTGSSRLLAGLLAATLLTANSAAADGLAGAYLAARQASVAHDYQAAARYYTRALSADPSNTALLEAAAVAQVAQGRIEAAMPIARRLLSISTQSQVAQLILLADDLRRRNYAQVITDLDAGRDSGALVNGLVRGWSYLAEGQVTEALGAFDAMAQTASLGPFAAFHKALALALVGDFEGADRILSGADGPAIGPSRRGVIAHAEVLAQLERYEDALARLDQAFGADPDPVIGALRGRLEAREPRPFELIESPAEGLAEVFFTVAGALNNEAEDTFTLLYSRIAESLAPRHTDAILLSASILERQKQYDLATAAYDRIDRSDPAFHFAELGRAETLRAAGRTEAAIEVLRQLAKGNPDLPDVHRALGDALRVAERYDEASAAYDTAIAALSGEDASQWVLYYVRGITHERSDRWELAEADFRKALQLEPEQPQVLNYLGYSFLELGANLDEALGMIERAVAARPNDGYIIDSLGWALYRLGRFEEAVEPMERAAALTPVDPVINDHLGDVYWAVGRRIEAQFQWKRALSFDPPDEDAVRIRRKLEVGLDVVLTEEGAEPIAVANDNGG
jgi:tetratricopeptide (TPR) repeat protein